MKVYQEPYQNLYETLVNSARNFPDKVAVIDDECEVTYSELLRRVDDLAFVLQNKYGMQEQEQIGFLMVNSARMVVAYYAAMKLGCIALMMNTKFQETELAALLETMDAKMIITDPRWLGKIEETAKKMKMRGVLSAEEPVAENQEGLVRGGGNVRNLENTSIIMHTSGTTGAPKGVMVTHGNILEAAYGYKDVQGLSYRDTTVISVPLFHILGLSCVTTMMMYLGATVVLSEFYHVEDVLRKIKKYKATHFHSVPAIYLQLIACDSPEKDLSSLRVAICGGAPISREHMDAFCEQAPNATLRLAYGMTETAGSGTLSGVHKGALMAVPNVEMKVVDGDHKVVPPGTIGEIVFCGPCIARKRWNAPGLPDDHMYSGDVGYMDEEGHVYVIDRVKDIVNRGGEKIFPMEIEKVMLTYPGVEKAAVYAVSDDKYGEVPAAAIILKEGMDVDPEALREYMKEHLAKFEVPVFVEKVEEFPVTHNGKVRKAELRRRAEERLKK